MAEPTPKFKLSIFVLVIVAVGLLVLWLALLGIPEGIWPDIFRISRQGPTMGIAETEVIKDIATDIARDTIIEEGDTLIAREGDIITNVTSTTVAGDTVVNVPSFPTYVTNINQALTYLETRIIDSQMWGDNGYALVPLSRVSDNVNINNGWLSVAGATTIHGNLLAKGQVDLGDGGESVTVKGSEVNITSAGEIKFTDTRISNIPFSLSDTGLSAFPAADRALIDALNFLIADGSGIVTAGSQGDVLYHNGTNWTSLAAGAAGRFLQTAGAGANPSWMAVMGTITDGTVANNLLRWDGVNWVETSVLSVAGAQVTSTANLDANSGLDVSGAALTMGSQNITGVGTNLTATAGLTIGSGGALVVGDGGDTINIDSSDWNISTVGAMTNINSVTNDSADLTLSTTTSGNVLLDSTGGYVQAQDNFNAIAGIDVTNAALTMGSQNITGVGTNLTATAGLTIGTGGALVIGDGGDTININSSDWNISTVGAMTNINSVTNDSADLTLSTTTSGNVLLDSTGGYVQAQDNFNAIAGIDITNAALTMGSQSITGVGTNLTATAGLTIGTGGALVIGDGGDTININSSDWNISTVGAMTNINSVSNDSADLTLSTTTSGNVLLDSTGGYVQAQDNFNAIAGIDITNAALTMGSQNITGVGTNITATAGLTIGTGGAFVLGDGGDTININSSDWNISTVGAMTGIDSVANSAALTITGGAASTWSTSAGLLTLQGAAGVTVDANGGDLTLDAATGSDVVVTLGGAAGDDLLVDTNVLVVESDNDRVGIGTAAPLSTLAVGSTDATFTAGEVGLTFNLGITRGGNTLYGTEADTHVNLGTDGTTGTNGEDYAYATIGGGYQNTAIDVYATVGGGLSNDATSDGATIPGGSGNTASGLYTTVSGGLTNTASGNYTTISGGTSNIASANRSTVSGGDNNNNAGAYSWAAGRYMTLTTAADRTFVWGYSAAAESVSQADSAIFWNDIAVPGTSAIKTGINTKAPGYALDVFENTTGYVANFFNDGNNADRYGIQVQGGADDASGTTYYFEALDGDGDEVGRLENNAGTFQLVDASDRRTKVNIDGIEANGLDIIKALKVKQYNRKQNPDGDIIYGFVAQEAQEIFPNMVSTGPTGFLGVSKESLIPILTFAMQQQQEQIEKLQVRGDTKSIQRDVDTLENRIGSLESRLNDQSNSLRSIVDRISALENKAPVSIPPNNDGIPNSIAGNFGVSGDVDVQGTFKVASIWSQNATWHIDSEGHLFMQEVKTQELKTGDIDVTEGANKAVGSGVLAVGQAELVISNTSITNQSYIQLTLGHARQAFTGNSEQSLAVRLVNAGQSFVVGTTDGQPAEVAMPFSYLIIN
ncbi:tail fiber domain-containing protein [Patescibacteria group bacterium]